MKNLKQTLAFIFLLFSFYAASAQMDSSFQNIKTPQLNRNRPKDYYQLQFGGLFWGQKPDSVPTKGFARSFNVYFSINLPFKTDPRFSVSVGAGLGSDHMFFDNDARKDVDIVGESGIRFRTLTGADTAIRYKSQKLHTAYLEAPIEFRFSTKPYQLNKSWKFGVGMKVGTLITAVDKARFEQDAQGNRNYNTKVKDRKNFNNLRLAAIARIGYGSWGVFFQYQLNEFIREGRGPGEIRPYSAGITFSAF